MLSWNLERFQCNRASTTGITVRGRSGAVLGMEPAAGESGAVIAKCLTTCLPEAGLTQVKHLATDNPSKKMLEEIQEACPNLLQCVGVRLGSLCLWRSSSSELAWWGLAPRERRRAAWTKAAQVQVGVWIPKAKVGPTADFFRPLGCPTHVTDRLTVQVLPPWWKLYRRTCTHPKSLWTTLKSHSMPLMRFRPCLMERHLLLRCLSTYPKPLNEWTHIGSCKYLACAKLQYGSAIPVRVVWQLFRRKIRHKVQGLLAPRAVHVGVDMRRSS